MDGELHVITRLQACLAHLGLPLEVDGPMLQDLGRYLSLLVRWGQRLNLTARAEPDILVERHLPDAFVLAAVTSLRLAPGAVVLDVGSGAGLPALPFAVLRRDLHLTLVEPNRRKCSFLRAVIDELRLRDVVVEQARLDDLAATPHADLVLSRATWSPTEWLTRAIPLITPGGGVAVFLAAETPPMPLGLEVEQHHYTLEGGAPRVLALYHVSREAPLL